MDNTTFAMNNTWTGGLCQLKGSIAIAIYVTMLIILAIVATIENLLIIIVIFKNEIFRTPSLLLLGILAMIDLFTGCVVTPVKASLTLKFDATLGTAFLWMFLAVILISLSTVTLISFDRFFHVYFLDAYNFTTLKLCAALFLCWLGPLLLIVLIASGLKAGIGAGVFALCYFFFCVLAMLVAYIAMLITLKIQSNLNEPVHEDILEQQKQAIKTTLIIIVTYFLMNFLPIVYIALTFMGIFSNRLCAVTFFLMLANSAVNPWIYCLRVPRMKEHIVQLVYRCNDEGGNGDEENRDISMTDADPVADAGEPAGDKEEDAVAPSNEEGGNEENGADDTAAATAAGEGEGDGEPPAATSDNEEKKGDTRGEN